MSCYVVPVEQIESIVSVVKCYEKDAYWMLKVNGIDVSKDHWEYDLADTLYQLNIDSVNDRYGEEEGYPTVLWEIKKVSAIDMKELELQLDLIANLRYQSCDVNDAEKDQRYRLLLDLETFFLREHYERTRKTQMTWGL